MVRRGLLLSVLLVAGLSGCASLSGFGSSVMRGYPNLPASARAQWAEAHPASAYKAQVIAGQVVPGMNRQEVLASWGQPEALGAIDADAASPDMVTFYAPIPPPSVAFTYLGGNDAYTIVHFGSDGTVDGITSQPGVLARLTPRTRSPHRHHDGWRSR